LTLFAKLSCGVGCLIGGQLLIAGYLVLLALE
jgi:hypothetical protein